MNELTPEELSRLLDRLEAGSTPPADLAEADRQDVAFAAQLLRQRVHTAPPAGMAWQSPSNSHPSNAMLDPNPSHPASSNAADSPDGLPDALSPASGQPAQRRRYLAVLAFLAFIALLVLSLGISRRGGLGSIAAHFGVPIPSDALLAVGNSTDSTNATRTPRPRRPSGDRDRNLALAGDDPYPGPTRGATDPYPGPHAGYDGTPRGTHAN